MVRIAISQAAFEAISGTLTVGSVAYEVELNEHGQRYVWLETAMADRFGTLRGPTESYSDVILRIAPDQLAAERTYRAIGRFIFEFSRAEYTIRYHLAQEIGLAEEHFLAVVESYDVAMLCTVAVAVFGKSRADANGAEIEDLINIFRELTQNRNRIAHGLWVPFKEGGTVHHVPRSLKPRTDANQAAVLEKLADEACSLRDKLGRAFSMVRIAISQAALEAIAKMLPLGGYDNEVNVRGERVISLDREVVGRLRAKRGPGESYSDVILRLADGSERLGS